MMMDVLPRKISAEKSTFESFAPVMEQFLNWCEEKKYMNSTKSIRNYIHKMSSEMIAKSQDPRCWGMAKSMFMGGVFQDSDEFEDGCLEKASSSISTCYGDTKIGRNDQCPCGSGKKYKKCCLNNK